VRWRLKVLALDVGTKTIGIAVGWSTTQITQPLITLQRKSVKKDAAQIKEICLQNEIEHIVTGLPLELDGNEGRSARLARQVGVAASEKTQLPLSYQDERYSTVEAESRLRKAGKNSVAIKKVVDQVAAMIILEDWFASGE
jgi:putative holliday junction resolvase